ncbi:MAG: hypothetical protein IPM32_00760 [Ignavibacteriae bacterium]|nr:hypothetical protein [Ignavibacteriota bacterium]
MELLINEFFEINKIEKPKNAQGYPTPFLLIKYLYENKLIKKNTYLTMEEIRNKGNAAAHGKNIVKKSFSPIKDISELLVWFLKHFDETENSLYLIVSRHSKLFSKVVNKSDYAFDLYQVIREITTLSIYKNTTYLVELTERILIDDILDSELINLINMTSDLVNKFDNWKYNYDPTQYKVNFIERLLGYKDIKSSPTKSFQDVFYTYLVEFDTLRENIALKYKIY